MPSDDAVKHLEFVQAAIDRMARNSFQLKSWSVALTSGLFALSVKEGSAAYVLLALFAILALWGLDGYYLLHERLYRALYADVCRQRGAATTTIETFSMSTTPYRNQVPAWLSTLRSPSVIGLHGVLFAVSVFYLILTH
jgi:hypothetical protein